MGSIKSKQGYITVSIRQDGKPLTYITYTDKPTLTKVTKLKDPSIKALVSKIQRGSKTCTIHKVEFGEGVDKIKVIRMFYIYLRQQGYKTVTMFTPNNEKSKWEKELNFPFNLDLYNLDIALLYRPL